MKILLRVLLKKQFHELLIKSVPAYIHAMGKEACVYCGEPADTTDHIKPRSKDGTGNWNNQAPACRICNGAKGDMPLLLFLVQQRQSPVHTVLTRKEKDARAMQEYENQVKLYRQRHLERERKKRFSVWKVRGGAQVTWDNVKKRFTRETV